MVNKKAFTLAEDELVLPRRRAFSAHKRRAANLRLKTLKRGGAKWHQRGGLKYKEIDKLSNLINKDEIIKSLKYLLAMPPKMPDGRPLKDIVPNDYINTNYGKDDDFLRHWIDIFEKTIPEDLPKNIQEFKDSLNLAKESLPESEKKLAENKARKNTEIPTEAELSGNLNEFSWEGTTEEQSNTLTVNEDGYMEFKDESGTTNVSEKEIEETKKPGYFERFLKLFKRTKKTANEPEEEEEEEEEDAETKRNIFYRMYKYLIDKILKSNPGVPVEKAAEIVKAKIQNQVDEAETIKSLTKKLETELASGKDFSDDEIERMMNEAIALEDERKKNRNINKIGNLFKNGYNNAIGALTLSEDNQARAWSNIKWANFIRTGYRKFTKNSRTKAKADAFQAKLKKMLEERKEKADEDEKKRLEDEAEKAAKLEAETLVKQNATDVAESAKKADAPTFDAADEKPAEEKEEEEEKVVVVGEEVPEPTGDLTLKLIGPTGSVLGESSFPNDTTIDTVITKWAKEIEPDEGLARNVDDNDPRKLKQYVLYFDDTTTGKSVEIDYKGKGKDKGKKLTDIAGTGDITISTTVTLRLRSKLYTFFERVLYGDLYYLVDVLYISNLYDYLINAEEKAEYIDLIQFKDAGQGPKSADQKQEVEEELEGGGTNEMESATEMEGAIAVMEGGRKRRKARAMAKARKMLEITDGTIVGTSASASAADAAGTSAADAADAAQAQAQAQAQADEEADEFGKKALVMTGGFLGMKWKTKREKENQYVGFPVPELTPTIEPKKDPKRFLKALVGMDTAKPLKKGEPLPVDDTLFNEFFYAPGSKEAKTEGINELVASMDTSLLGRVSEFLSAFMVCQNRDPDLAKADAGKSLIPEQGIPVIIASFVKEGSGFSELWKDDEGVTYFKTQLDVAQNKTRTVDKDTKEETIEDLPNLGSLPVDQQLERRDKQIDAEIEVFNLIAPKVVDDTIDDWRARKEGQLRWNRTGKKFEFLKEGVRDREEKADSAAAEAAKKPPIIGGATDDDDMVPVQKETSVEEFYKLLTKVNLYYEENENMKDNRMYDIDGDLIVKGNEDADKFNKWLSKNGSGAKLPSPPIKDENGYDIMVEDPNQKAEDKEKKQIPYNGIITNPVEVINTFISNYKFFRIMATMDLGGSDKKGGNKTWYKFYDQFIRRTARLLQRDDKKAAPVPPPVPREEEPRPEGQGGPMEEEGEEEGEGEGEEVQSPAELRGTVYSKGKGDVPGQSYDLATSKEEYAEILLPKNKDEGVFDYGLAAHKDEEEGYMALGGAKPTRLGNTLIETDLINEFIDKKVTLHDPSKDEVDDTQRKAVAQMIIFANFINLTLVKNLIKAGLGPDTAAAQVTKGGSQVTKGGSQVTKGGSQVTKGGATDADGNEIDEAAEAAETAKQEEEAAIEKRTQDRERSSRPLTKDVPDTQGDVGNMDLAGTVLDTGAAFAVTGSVVTLVTNVAVQAAIANAANYIGVVMYPAVMHAYSLYFMAASQALGFAGASIFSAGIGAVVIVSIWAINAYLNRLAKKSVDFFIAVDEFMNLLRDMSSPPDKLNEAYTSLIRNYAFDPDPKDPTKNKDPDNLYITYFIYRLFEDVNVYRMRALIAPPSSTDKSQIDFFNIYQLVAQKGKPKPFMINTKKNAEWSGALGGIKQFGSYLWKKIKVLKFLQNADKIKRMIKRANKALDAEKDATDLKASIASSIKAAVETGANQYVKLKRLEKVYKGSKKRLDPKEKIDKMIDQKKFDQIPKTVAFLLAATTDGNDLKIYQDWFAYFRMKYGTAEEKNVFADIDKHIIALIKARELLRDVINEPNKRTMNEPEKLLQIKYYLNFICYAFLTPRTNETVTTLQGKNILKKMNFYYQTIGAENYKKSFTNYELNPFEKMRLRNKNIRNKKPDIILKSASTLSDVADMDKRKKLVGKFTELYGKNHLVLSKQSPDNKIILLSAIKSLFGPRSGAGKVIKGQQLMSGSNAIELMNGMERYFSMLRCKQFTDEGKLVSIVDDIELNSKRVYENIITLYNKMELEKTKTLQTIYITDLQQTGKDPASKLLKNFFKYETNGDEIGEGKQVSVLQTFLGTMSKTILPIAIKYSEFVVEEKKKKTADAEALKKKQDAQGQSEADKKAKEAAEAKAKALKAAADGIVEAAKDIQAEYEGEDPEGPRITKSIDLINAKLGELNTIKPGLEDDRTIRGKIKDIRSALGKVAWEGATQGGGGGSLAEYQAAVNAIAASLKSNNPNEENVVRSPINVDNVASLVDNLIKLEQPSEEDKDTVVDLLNALPELLKNTLNDSLIRKNINLKNKIIGSKTKVEKKIEAIKMGVNVRAEVIDKSLEILNEAISAFTGEVDKEKAYTALKTSLSTNTDVKQISYDERNRAFNEITANPDKITPEQKTELRGLLDVKEEVTVVAENPVPVVKEKEEEEAVDVEPMQENLEFIKGDAKAAAAANLEEEKPIKPSSSEIGTGTDAPITTVSSAQTTATTSSVIETQTETPTVVTAPPKDKKAAAAALVKAATELQSLINVMAAASIAAAAKGTQGRSSIPGTSGDLSSLMARIAALEAEKRVSDDARNATKLTEDEAAIRAIMTGEDALAHKIKFLVDIPKWQQFKMIGEDGSSVEEFMKETETGLQRIEIESNAKKLGIDYALLKQLVLAFQSNPPATTAEQLKEQATNISKIKEELAKVTKELEEKNKVEMNKREQDFLGKIEGLESSLNAKIEEAVKKEVTLASGTSQGGSGGSKAHKKTRHGHMRSGPMLGRAKYSRKKHHMRGGKLDTSEPDVSAEDVFKLISKIAGPSGSLQNPANPGANPGSDVSTAANPDASSTVANPDASSTVANPAASSTVANPDANPSPVASSTDPNSAASSSGETPQLNPVVEEVKPVPEAGPDTKAAETVAAETVAGPDAKAAEPVTETVAGPGGGKRSSPKRSSPKRSSPKRSSPKRSSPKNKRNSNSKKHKLSSKKNKRKHGSSKSKKSKRTTKKHSKNYKGGEPETPEPKKAEGDAPPPTGDAPPPPGDAPPGDNGANQKEAAADEKLQKEKEAELKKIIDYFEEAKKNHPGLFENLSVKAIFEEYLADAQNDVFNKKAQRALDAANKKAAELTQKANEKIATNTAIASGEAKTQAGPGQEATTGAETPAPTGAEGENKEGENKEGKEGEPEKGKEGEPEKGKEGEKKEPEKGKEEKPKEKKPKEEKKKGGAWHPPQLSRFPQEGGNAEENIKNLRESLSFLKDEKDNVAGGNRYGVKLAQAISVIEQGILQDIKDQEIAKAKEEEANPKKEKKEEKPVPKLTEADIASKISKLEEIKAFLEEKDKAVKGDSMYGAKMSEAIHIILNTINQKLDDEGINAAKMAKEKADAGDAADAAENGKKDPRGKTPNRFRYNPDEEAGGRGRSTRRAGAKRKRSRHRSKKNKKSRRKRSRSKAQA